MVAKNPLSIDELKPGMMIVQIEQQNGPVKLRKSGLVKKLRHGQRFERNGGVVADH